MKAHTSLHARAEQYLAERRRLGFSLRTPAYSLHSFVRHIQVVSHHGPLTIDVMTSWARRDSHGSDDPNTWARRLKHLRSFARWLRQFEPLTEIPDHTVFGRIDERQAPHIYSENEIVDLLAAARRRGPASSPRGVVFETLFGLVASCGLRISEALALRNDDVDLRHGMLLIRKATFGKSRQVPMHRSTVEALRRYRSTLDARRSTWRANPLRPKPHSSSAHEVNGTGWRWVIDKFTGSSSNCASTWAGATEGTIMRRAFMTCATHSLCAASRSGRRRASMSIRRCWRCPPMSGTRKLATPTGTFRRRRS